MYRDPGFILFSRPSVLTITRIFLLDSKYFSNCAISAKILHFWYFSSLGIFSYSLQLWLLKDRAHLSTFKFFIFEKFSCFIVLVVFLVIVQSSELISVWFREKKWHFFLNFVSYHIFAIYVGGASLWLPTARRLIAVSGARLPLADGLVVRCIKNAPPC